jgi:hypothetical protein
LCTEFRRLCQEGLRLLTANTSASNSHTEKLGEDDHAEVFMERGPTGYGFMFSTNTKEYKQGIVHYVSLVDAGGPVSALLSLAGPIRHDQCPLIIDHCPAAAWYDGELAFCRCTSFLPLVLPIPDMISMLIPFPNPNFSVFALALCLPCASAIGLLLRRSLLDCGLGTDLWRPTAARFPTSLTKWPFL